MRSVTNFDEDDNGKNTKTCHCAEDKWIRGDYEQWGRKLGEKMKLEFGNFYVNGTFGENIKSFQEMNFDKFNLIVSADDWTQGAVRDWDWCNMLDEIHETIPGEGYSQGRTKENPLGPNPHPDYL